MDKKEVVRDLMAFGSIPFLVIVLVRVAMVGNFREMTNIILAVFIFYLFSLKMKKMDYHIPFLLILAVFISIYYNDYFFAFFALLIFALALYGAKKYLKVKNLTESVLVTEIAIIISYVITFLLKIPDL